MTIAGDFSRGEIMRKMLIKWAVRVLSINGVIGDASTANAIDEFLSREDIKWRT